MSEGDNALWRIVYPILASIAGSITALSFQPWQGMSKGQITLSLFVGATFAYFVSPLIFRNVGDVKMGGGILYLMASGSNYLIPLVIRRMFHVEQT